MGSRSVRDVNVSCESTLEEDRLERPMSERLLHAAARLERTAPRSLGYPLRREQTVVFDDFAAYLLDVATRPSGRPGAPFCRIVLPPRTGKTVIAAHIIARTGLTATILVPTLTLVHQTARSLLRQLPGVPIGLFCGDKSRVVEHGVNIATYAMVQRGSLDRLPLPLRTAALVFADEAHHAMTKSRHRVLLEAFDAAAIRIALTATPNYDSERRLDRFFPDLVHEVSVCEALDLGLLAPLRMWVAEVDADGSRVRMRGGDYDHETLGRLMSSAPFFRAVEVFRYAPPNADRPALLACASRQQARDLYEYLLSHRPSGRPAPRLVLGDTPKAERERVLSRFERGAIDTLIQVRVLVEGWDSPRCKLLIDLAPSASRVRATQKYFRVMTRQGDAEARIYVLLPKGLSFPPVLPMDLFGADLEVYRCGSLLGPAGGEKSELLPLETHVRTPVAGVEIKKRVVLAARMEKPRLDRRRARDIQRVLATCPEFDPLASCNLFRFRGLFFRHRLFAGRGDFLLEWLKIPPTRAGFGAFLARHCPESAAVGMLEENGGLAPERTCLDDVFHLERNMAAAGGGPLVWEWRALGGRNEDPPTPEEEVLRLERDAFLVGLVRRLPPRKREIIARRFGLLGHPEWTWTELAEPQDVSVVRMRQLVADSLRRLRNFLHRAGSRVDIEHIEWGQRR